MDIEVIAQRGSFVILRHDRETGRVLDLRTERLFAPVPLLSLMARGYWSPFEGRIEEVADILNRSHDHQMEREGQDALPLAEALDV